MLNPKTIMSRLPIIICIFTKRPCVVLDNAGRMRFVSLHSAIHLIYCFDIHNFILGFGEALFDLAYLTR